MRIAIIQFPGSNCERETMLAVKRAGMQPIEFLWNEPKEKLTDMQGYIIVGGFSYEDRSRAGIIAALDPLMSILKEESSKGKPLLGICNGAQILVETGLVPGLENNKIGMALSENKRIADNKILGTGFYNAWVNIRLSDEYQRNAFTSGLTPKTILQIPVAHGEGRFMITNALLQEIKMHGLSVFQYCDSDGNILNDFPTNPNGSVDNIAAISNKAGNIMAIMPHPERTSNGDSLFEAMRDYINAGLTQHTIPLHYYPRRQAVKSYQSIAKGSECIVELIITDNQAVTVQHTLHQLGIPVRVTRQVHWEIECDSDTVLAQIKKSGVLLNERKEAEVTSMLMQQAERQGTEAVFLVREKENINGQQTLQVLQDHFCINNIHAIRQGVLWHFSVEDANIADLVDKILQTNIIANPYAHDYYQYC